jgi:hypothetical protein
MPTNTDTGSRDKMIADLELEGLPESAQDEIIEKVEANILKAVTFAALEHLPGDAIEDAKKMSEAGDSAGLGALLRKHIPDFDTFVTSEAQKEIEAFKAIAAQKLAEK